jgi:hypothetical protein
MEIFLTTGFQNQTDLIKMQQVSKAFYKNIEKVISICQVKFDSWEEEPTAFY